MLNSRKELYEVAKKSCIGLMERAAKRYESGEIYVNVDHIGYECTRLEELFRPLWGSMAFFGDEDFVISIGGKKIHITDFVTKVISEGTDTESEKRFDKNVTEQNSVGFANQCITEIAAYMIAVSFAKERLWSPLSQSQKDKIAGWIHKYAMIALKKSWPNNHYWYPVFTIEILKNLGYYDPDSEQYLAYAYEELEKLYVGNGWYCDGKDFGRFDYYEAWAHHTYTLLWILIADKNSDNYSERCQKYKARTGEFLKFYSHYFDSDGGMCAYGRSLSYRFAAVSVFGLAALTGCNMDMGLAKSIILKNIGYFYEKNIPSYDGNFGCGYLYESMRFAENYASEGATTCFTEGYMCLLADENHPLWQAEEKPLRIETSDYLEECPVENLGFLLQGENSWGGVTLFNNAIHYFQGKNVGFNDMCGYYSKFCYNSRAGFAISSRDKAGFDNMISLCTDDMTMASLRGKIYTVSSAKDLLVSYHIPFSNDPETRVTTYILPLSQGYHVRVQKVELSRPYIVREGGFSIGTLDDDYTFSSGRLYYKGAVSEISVVSNCETCYELQKIHPGMHNLCPLAYYPNWRTKGELKRGEYIFATSVFFSDAKEPAERPEIKIEGSIVTVAFRGNVKKIDVSEYVKDKDN